MACRVQHSLTHPQFLLGKKIVHRDIKPENTAITSFKSSGKPHIALLDFGVATTVKEAQAFTVWWFAFHHHILPC